MININDLNIKANGQAGIEFRNSLIQGAIEYNQKEREWVVQLKKEGFKAAHPNDGWVNREENIVDMVYPQFNDNP